MQGAPPTNKHPNQHALSIRRNTAYNLLGALVPLAVSLVPIREEQLQERLGERFRELDIPLLVEWPDGRRAALLFVLEEETDPGRFSIHRLAHYCLDLAELFATERVVPVVIFLHPGTHPARLRLGGDAHSYLEFRYLACTCRGFPLAITCVATTWLPGSTYPKWPTRRTTRSTSTPRPCGAC